MRRFTPYDIKSAVFVGEKLRPAICEDFFEVSYEN